ncbi:MAG: hypothetical protein ACXWQJ_19195 [Bdellovibrionota bacterium]
MQIPFDKLQLPTCGLIAALLLGSTFLQSNLANAIDCFAECYPLRAESRRAALTCEVACEKKDPKNITYCPEYTPCILDCENRFPDEKMTDQVSKDEKIRCMGSCMTKYFKIGCEKPPPPQEGSPAGSGQRSSSVSGGQSDPAEIAKPRAPKARAVDPEKQISASGEGGAAFDGGGSASMLSTSSANPARETKDRNRQNTDSNGSDSRNQNSSATAMPKGSTPVEGLVEAMLADETELSLFVRVTRKYREKQNALQIIR